MKNWQEYETEDSRARRDPVYLDRKSLLAPKATEIRVDGTVYGVGISRPMIQMRMCSVISYEPHTAVQRTFL